VKFVFKDFKIFDSSRDSRLEFSAAADRVFALPPFPS